MIGNHHGLLAAAACLGPFLLDGCASHQSAAYEVARSIVRPNAAIDAQPLDPALHYLRVTSNGKAALMVLGYTDPDASGPPVQIWYSAVGEVLRLQDGRLKGLTGTPVEWRAVSWPTGVPGWKALVAGQTISAATLYERLRDEMPGYRLNVRDQLRLQPVAPPANTELTGLAPGALTWFEEWPADALLPPARYGLRPDTAEVIYGEQCLHLSLCLSWQRWPPLQGVQP
jgi:hypothetical protein